MKKHVEISMVYSVFPEGEHLKREYLFRLVKVNMVTVCNTDILSVEFR
jgi:hypothetical protein